MLCFGHSRSIDYTVDGSCCYSIAPFSDTKNFDVYTTDQSVSEWYETDINHHIENLPYFEDEMIKENEVGSVGAQSEFELLK